MWWWWSRGMSFLSLWLLPTIMDWKRGHAFELPTTSQRGRRWTRLDALKRRSNTPVDQFGAAALSRVQSLASFVTDANAALGQPPSTGETTSMDHPPLSDKKFTKIQRRKKQLEQELEQQTRDGRFTRKKGGDRTIVLSALANLERDMQILDNLAGQRPQLSLFELALLSCSVSAAALGPVFFRTRGIRVSEVLAPAAAAFSASIGIGAEYTGKVAVADGKEVAAATIQCAAEAEGFLANAERVKAVTPLCVGVGATAASFALLVPVLVDALSIASDTQLVTEFYLFCPIVAVIAAAVSSLALQETRAYTSRATNVGNRRFAKSGLVGKTWLSASEQIGRNSQRTTQRWKSFGGSVLPAPIIGALLPGDLPTKAIVTAAIAAAQSTYCLAHAESALARATDAVALKARSAAICDTYANQGARSAAILPYTSALSSLCTAATAALVELPWIEHLGLGAGGVLSRVLLIGFFPALSSLFAAAASVSKARCEVDAEAAIQSASTLALDYENGGEAENDPVLRPFRGVVELIRITATTGWNTFQKSRAMRQVFWPMWSTLRRVLYLKRGEEETEQKGDGGTSSQTSITTYKVVSSTGNKKTFALAV